MLSVPTALPQKLIYPELSYVICGILYKVRRELGDGCLEKHVQRAVAIALTKNGMIFKQQVMVLMKFEDSVIGRYFLDFLIDNKIILELKVGERLSKKDFDQVKNYLRQADLKLGLLARFGRNGVTIHRVLRPL